MLIAASGKVIYDWCCPLLASVALRFTIGSTYWADKWILHEKNETNRRYIACYLQAEEISLLNSLQKGLCLHCKQTFTTRWEYLRLLAVMERVNNGSDFARALLMDAADPGLLLRLSTEQFGETLLKKIRPLSSCASRHHRLEEIDLDHHECMPTKYTSFSK